MAATRRLIVTGADSAYFRFALGCVESIRRAEAAGAAPVVEQVCLIDFGLTDAESAELSRYCDVLRRPAPPFRFGRSDHPESRLMANFARAFLPQYFPGFDLYYWLDADTWVQHGSALSDLGRAALHTGLALVPSLDRSYRSLYDTESVHYRWMQPVMEEAYGADVARRMEYRPVLNSGVFAATRDSPVWDRFAARLQAIHDRARSVFDQPALNVAVYQDGVPFYPLDSRSNWLCCHSIPRLDTERGVLTEPLLPHRDIGIVHLTAHGGVREVAAECSDGSCRKMCLDYHSVRASHRPS